MTGAVKEDRLFHRRFRRPFQGRLVRRPLKPLLLPLPRSGLGAVQSLLFGVSKAKEKGRSGDTEKDSTVPEDSSYRYSRGLGIPHMDQVSYPER